MEFNNIKQTTLVIASTPEVVADTVILNSSKRPTVNSINNGITVNIKNNNDSTVTLTHDVTDLKKEFDADLIKTSLVNVYGKSGRLHASSRNIESIDLPLSQFPAKLEYKFVVLENGKEVEYTSTYNLPITDSLTKLNIQGVSNSSQTEATIPDAVKSLDDEIVNIKNNLQNFSTIYDDSQKKYVSLHSYLLSIKSSLDNLTKQLADVTEKTKGL